MTELVTDEPRLVSTLAFGMHDVPASEGLIALYEDGTVRLMPSDATRSEFDTYSVAMQMQAIAWGASLLALFAGVGTILWFRNRRAPAFALFSLSGLTGVSGAYLRREAARVGDELTKPHRIGDRAGMNRTRDGGVELWVREPAQPPWRVRFGVGEFDPEAADAFIATANTYARVV